MADIVRRVLMRHASSNTPETRLAVAVIGQAINDTHHHDVESHVTAREWEDVRADAQTFLAGSDLDTWAELAGLDPGFVREVSQRDRINNLLQWRT